MTLGKLIRDGRVAKRMTLRSLAADLNVSVPYLSYVEHDRRSVSLERLAAISRILDIPLSELEAHGGVSRGLVTWLRSRPDVLELLHEARRTGQPLILLPLPRRDSGGGR